jgi:hypothetical protein
MYEEMYLELCDNGRIKNTKHVRLINLLGVYLRDILKRSDHDLREYLSLVNTSLITSKIRNIEQLYKNNKHFIKQWAEIAEQRMDLLYRYLQNEISSVQFKEIKHLSNEDQLITIRKIYGSFGDLLFYWPEIYACVETQKWTLIN